MTAPRRCISLALLALSAVPLAAKAPYLWRAWTSSPIDRAHLGLYGALALVAAGAAIAFLRRLRLGARGGVAAGVAMALFLAGYAAGVLRDVNGLQLLSAVGLLWAAAWLAFGRVAAVAFAPAALMAAFAVPGTLYWMHNFTAACRFTPRAAFAPEFTPGSQPGMLGREVAPSQWFKRFFRTSDAHQFRYADISNRVSVLTVSIGGDIHEVHPATHCLRTGGWRVVSERIVQVEHPDGGILDVDEAVVDSLKGRRLVWIWYSSDKVSTGSFLHFRRMYSEDGRWRTYQVATPAGAGDEGLEAARNLLRRFLAGKGRK